MAFLICRSCSFQVKAQLYEIRKLMIIDRSTAADDEVSNYESPTFRGCSPSSILCHIHNKTKSSNKFE